MQLFLLSHRAKKFRQLKLRLEDAQLTSLSYELARESVYNQTERTEVISCEIIETKKERTIQGKKCQKSYFHIRYNKIRCEKDLLQKLANGVKREIIETKAKRVKVWSTVNPSTEKNTIYAILRLLSIEIPYLGRFEACFSLMQEKINGVPLLVSFVIFKRVTVTLNLRKLNILRRSNLSYDDFVIPK